MFRGSLMLATIFLARHLDTTDFATYSYFQLTIAMLATYAALGMGVTASRFFAEVGHERPDRAPPPIGTLWCLSILVSAAFAVAVMGIPANLLNAGLDMPRWLLALGVFVMALGVVPGGAILGLEMFRQSAFVSTLSGLTILIGAWWSATHGSQKAAMAALVAAFLVNSGGNAILVLRKVGVTRLFGSTCLHRQEMGRILGFTGPMLAVSFITGSGAWLLGRMILGGPGGEHAFALYSIGLQWFALALLLPGMLSRVILPRLVRTDTGDKRDTDGSRMLVRRGALMTLIVASGVALVGTVLGPWLLGMYGDKYEVDRWFIAAFMLAAILSAPANLVGNAIVARDGQVRWLYLTLAWLAALLAAGMLSLPMGAWAGAVSQGVAAAVLSTLALVSARKSQLI